MKRKLLFLERFMYGDGSAPFHGVFSLKIRGSFTADNLQHALARLQARHPMLNMVIAEDRKGVPWFVLNEHNTPIPLRIQERMGDEDWMQETKKEWATRFEVGAQPLLRVVWLRGVEVSDLLLVVHHCAFDGGAVLCMVHDILGLLDNPEKEMETGIGLPFTTLRDLVPGEIYASRKNRLKRTVLGGVAQLAAVAVPVLKRLQKRSVITSREDYFITWTIDKETTSALTRRCANRRVTPHAALTTAFLYAFLQLKGTSARNRILCPVDIRRYVKEIKKDTLFAFGMGVNLSVDKKATRGFWEAAQQVQAELSRQTGKLNGYDFLMNFECFHPLLARRSKGKTKEMVNYDMVFSNLGKLDIPKSYSSFEVEAIYPPTVMGPTGNYNTVLTSTFRGQMDFSFTGSTHHFQYEEAVAVKEMAMEFLLREQ